MLKMVQEHLLTPADLDPHVVVALASRMPAHIDWGDVYVQRIESEALSLEEGKLKNASYSLDQGAAVRINQGTHTGFAYSDDLSVNALEQAHQAALGIARSGATQCVALPARHRSVAAYAPHNPMLLPVAQKIDWMRWVDARARSVEPRLSDVQCSLRTTQEHVFFAGMDGHVAADVRPLIVVIVRVTLRVGDRCESGRASFGTRADGSVVDEILAERLVQKAIHQARTNLEAQAAPAGSYPVVLASGLPGVLLHEAVGHGLEGDFNRKGISVYSGRMGQQVTSSLCTIVDDGTVPDQSGSLNIDDEGIPGARNVLVEQGILKNYMQDRVNARLMNMPPTGNGRRESYACPPMPRMTNTYMLPGESTLEEMIASVKDGVYAVDFSGGQVDITSGDFVFSTIEAYRIQNGRITYPVKEATLIGNGPEVMNRVTMVGDTLAFDDGTGMCGKNGQSVPVGIGQPALLVSSVTFGGTEHA